MASSIKVKFVTRVACTEIVSFRWRSEVTMAYQDEVANVLSNLMIMFLQQMFIENLYSLTLDVSLPIQL